MYRLLFFLSLGTSFDSTTGPPRGGPDCDPGLAMAALDMIEGAFFLYYFLSPSALLCILFRCYGTLYILLENKILLQTQTDRATDTCACTHASSYLVCRPQKPNAASRIGRCLSLRCCWQSIRASIPLRLIVLSPFKGCMPLLLFMRILGTGR
uniref:Uncharacterized protein n=1 Tax=Anopheles darlingi TaxID=43151 RepID=A0A2M4DPT5_ANODA